MKKLYTLSAMMLLSSLLYSQTVLLNNGPLITHSGTPAWSVLQAPNTTYGVNNSKAILYRVADEFSITDSTWAIDSIVFFGYQTFALTDSTTFTSYNVRIWNGIPDSAGSTIVWGDTSTNVLTYSSWSGIYRATSMGGDMNRPIMRNVCTTSALTLPPGANYWIDWQAAGSLSSGPWQPFITIVGQVATGNAKQFDGSTWSNMVDLGSGQPQGCPFIIYGNSTPAGITENTTNQSFNIYPNPVSDQLTIEIEGISKNVSFEIINSLGQIVFTGNISGKTMVRTSSFAPGIYIIKLERGNTFEYKKIIKQ